MKGFFSRKAAVVVAAVALILGGFFTTAAVYADQSNGGEITTFKALPQRGDAAAPMAMSWRELRCGIHRLVRQDFGARGLPDGYPVAVTLAENGSGGSEFLGSALMNVYNVVVWGGQIQVVADIQWDHGLCVWYKFSVGA
ncbi:hypothetical protein [Kibdelosporangium aridum]|uniref:DUF4430 domain-containing protein n=1 Tax=Kibdelosporangium aridum TaxID=2030 RepID=A0A1Y5X258_KIBAR|nr:hypothetical protein [Kibdelosporangium aridum]SMC60826.1 hypothetical protein SAMN05661093_00886 [Kibdelosporangium aridum]